MKHITAPQLAGKNAEINQEAMGKAMAGMPLRVLERITQQLPLSVLVNVFLDPYFFHEAVPGEELDFIYTARETLFARHDPEARTAQLKLVQFWTHSTLNSPHRIYFQAKRADLIQGMQSQVVDLDYNLRTALVVHKASAIGTTIPLQIFNTLVAGPMFLDDFRFRLVCTLAHHLSLSGHQATLHAHITQQLNTLMQVNEERPHDTPPDIQSYHDMRKFTALSDHWGQQHVTDIYNYISANFPKTPTSNVKILWYNYMAHFQRIGKHLNAVQINTCFEHSIKNDIQWVENMIDYLTALQLQTLHTTLKNNIVSDEKRPVSIIKTSFSISGIFAHRWNDNQIKELIPLLIMYINNADKSIRNNTCRALQQMSARIHALATPQQITDIFRKLMSPLFKNHSASDPLDEIDYRYENALPTLAALAPCWNQTERSAIIEKYPVPEIFSTCTSHYTQEELGLLLNSIFSIGSKAEKSQAIGALAGRWDNIDIPRIFTFLSDLTPSNQNSEESIRYKIQAIGLMAQANRWNGEQIEAFTHIMTTQLFPRWNQIWIVDPRIGAAAKETLAHFINHWTPQQKSFVFECLCNINSTDFSEARIKLAAFATPAAITALKLLRVFPYEKLLVEFIYTSTQALQHQQEQGPSQQSTASVSNQVG